MQSNSYLSIESSKRKIWKWWSAFRQETRMLGEVKRGSCQTCALLRVSIIVKRIAFVSWDKEDRAKTLLIFTLQEEKFFIYFQKGWTVLFQQWFALRKVNSSAKLLEIWHETNKDETWLEENEQFNISLILETPPFRQGIVWGLGTQSLNFLSISTDAAIIQVGGSECCWCSFIAWLSEYLDKIWTAICISFLLFSVYPMVTVQSL